jgi:hypothetical protein
VKEIKLKSWSHFEPTLRAEIKISTALVRNFARVTFDNVGTEHVVEIDSLAVVRATGTDRRENASMWNASGFDFDHDLMPSGRKPNEIVYAFLIDLKPKPYLVSVADGKGAASFKALDLTDYLTEHSAIIVYDPAHLHRAAPNEYWFLCDPLEAALLLFTLDDEETEEVEEVATNCNCAT